MFLHKLLDKPKLRILIAEILFVGSIIAWPLTQLTIFSSEPAGILGLSWFAIILTAYDIIVTTEVREDQDSDDTQ